MTFLKSIFPSLSGCLIKQNLPTSAVKGWAIFRFKRVTHSSLSPSSLWHSFTSSSKLEWKYLKKVPKWIWKQKEMPSNFFKSGRKDFERYILWSTQKVALSFNAAKTQSLFALTWKGSWTSWCSPSRELRRSRRSPIENFLWWQTSSRPSKSWGWKRKRCWVTLLKAAKNY